MKMKELLEELLQSFYINSNGGMYASWREDFELSKDCPEIYALLREQYDAEQPGRIKS